MSALSIMPRAPVVGAGVGTEVVNISPQLAQEMLQNVGDNVDRLTRTKERRYVEALSHQMLTGNWRLSGDAIVLGLNRVVLNGRHRLLAVVQSNTTQRFLVMYLPSCSHVRDVPDASLPRTRVFQLGISPVLGKTARLVLQLLTSLDGALQPLAQYEQFIQEALPLFNRLVIPEKGRFSRSAPVVLACMLRTNEHPDSVAWVNEMLHAFTQNNPIALTPLLYSLWRQWDRDVLKSGNSLAARIWKAFDPTIQQTDRLMIKNEAALLDELKDEIRSTFPKTFSM